ncbi:unnamed protein product [Paramecium pentaurelia]|uniref:Uncharacterized protein n=1 Tax=Paramecium pentaurelia TaxID=43138 RepID=A0A8S1XVI1_9CILI|nr:unnamed protein product [Paramecium pentaurelia]
MNTFMHHQQQMAESSTANFVRFTHLRDFIQLVVQYFHIDVAYKIKSSLTIQNREAQKSLEHIIEDTEK